MHAKRTWSDRILFTSAWKLVRAARVKVLQESDLLDLPYDLQPLHSSMPKDKIAWTDGSKLPWTLLKACRKRLIPAYSFYAVGLVLSLLQPVLVHQFVGAVSKGLQDISVFHSALFFAVALGSTAILRGLCNQYFFYGTLTSFQWMVNALNEKIFRHSLVMTQEARLKTPVGDIVNFMSTDSEATADFASVFMDSVYTVCVILGVSVLLFVYLGWSAIVPLVLLACLGPVTRILAKRFSHLDEVMMRERDQRVSLMAQILNAIRVIKFFAWEKSIIHEVGDIRVRELSARWKMARAEAFASVTYVAVSSIVLFTALAVHVYRGFTLDPALVFTCVSLFALLEEPFGSLSWLISRFMNAFVSGKRIASFLKTPSLPPRAVLPDSTESALALRVSSLASFGHLELNIKAGESIALVGPVGGGKSTLLSLLLGENIADRGKVHFKDLQGHSVHARTAYVPQEAYIVNGSLQENLLFGAEDAGSEKLQKAIFLANFENDLSELPAGLKTEIGEKGVNLSGGQKQRVSLARSFLRDPQVIFLDDPLSAVDVETERKICDRLLFGVWQKKTRIVATHRLENLAKFDRILFIDQGRVTDQGTFESLSKGSPRFMRFMLDHQRTHGAMNVSVLVENTVATSQIESRITEDEEREIGAVKSSVYLDYFRSLGGDGPFRIWNIALLILGSAVSVSLPLAQRWWLGASSNVQQGHPATGLASFISDMGFTWLMQNPLVSIGIYGIIGLVALILSLGSSLFWVSRGIRAGRSLHDRMLNSLMSATIRFFDSTPVGRILQRFSRDVESVDLYMQRSFESATNILVEVTMTLTLILVTVPISILLVLPILLFYYRVQRDYRRPAREVKRMDSIGRSPRYAHFKETLVGLPVIRGFGREDWFLESFFAKLTHSQRMFFNHYLLNRWFSSRVPLIGGVIAIVTAVSIAYSAREGQINAGTAGLLTIYMLSFWGYLNWGIRIFADIESRMTSVERLRTYASLPSEKSTMTAVAKDLPSSWPAKGELIFEDVTVRYASHLPAVLKGVSFKVQPGQRVGLIGRTGSGKSTLLQTLFRFLELDRGKILLDGEDIAAVPLQRLRRSLAIIPQDPTLFQGTIRSNLDRYHQSTDEHLMSALNQAAMGEFVLQLPGQLNFPVVENGLNFSQGQRQLLCLARALLTNAKVIVFDEATASVDVETDALLQEVIRKNLKGITLLIIAHRLGTVSDCDQVVELAGGRVISEFVPTHPA